MGCSPETLLQKEALVVEWQIAPTRGCIQIMGKDLMRKELGRSPDRLDSVVIGLGMALGGVGFRSVGGATVDF